METFKETPGPYLDLRAREGADAGMGNSVSEKCPSVCKHHTPRACSLGTPSPLTCAIGNTRRSLALRKHVPGPDNWIL